MKPETNIKNVTDLMRQCQEVKSLTEKARQSDELQRALQRLLPSMLADYCQVRSFEQGVLALNAASGSAATQLRFLTPQILPKLQKMSIFQGLTSITIRTQAPEARDSRRQVRQTPRVSDANRQLLSDTADGISDPGLAESLRRLAMTLGKNGKD
jgi:hypothetical protein